MITTPQHCARTETCSTEWVNAAGITHVITWGFEEGNPDMKIINSKDGDE